MRYDVLAQCGKDRNGKFRSCKIGAAFPDEKSDRINIILNALPLTKCEGDMAVARLTLMPATAQGQGAEPERVRSQASQGARRGQNRDEGQEDEAVPF